VQHRAVVRGGFEHAHQQGGLLHVEAVGEVLKNVLAAVLMPKALLPNSTVLR
jgi:hypothetical protein